MQILVEELEKSPSRRIHLKVTSLQTKTEHFVGARPTTEKHESKILFSINVSSLKQTSADALLMSGRK